VSTSVRTPVTTASVRLGRAIVLTFAIATGVIAANLYYAQPLLEVMGHDLHASAGASGAIVTVTQVGFAIGLIFVLPAADMIERRRLLTGLLALDAAALVAVAAAPNLPVSLIAFAVLGLANVSAQVLVPAAANMAGDAERGKVVGTVISGLLIGMLLARTVSGVLGQALGWRPVFLLAAGLVVAVAIALRFVVPAQPSTLAFSYGQLLRSGLILLRTHRTLRIRAVLGGLGFAAFSAFWSTIALLLAGGPYHYGTATIGLVGLLGVAGALIANLTGRIRRPDHPLPTIGAIVLLAATFIVLWIGRNALAASIIGTILLDIAVQGLHVLNQRQIYELDGAARNRINSVYMTFYFLGGAAGSGAAAVAWSAWGWSGVCAVGVVIAIVATAVWAANTVRPRKYT
jgi:predicted MFS family arabinose efflux permease